MAGDNFHPQYVDVNPNGTVPTLVTSKLASPLIDSREILQFIDNEKSLLPRLQPVDGCVAAHAEQIIELVHEEWMSTNLILLQSRDADEMRTKQSSVWKTFVDNRQHKLMRFARQRPDCEFYSNKLKQNTYLSQLYGSNAVDDAEHRAFYAETQAQYRTFAMGLERLDGLIKLPYATGSVITSADLHVVPWLAHAMWGAGGTEVQDFVPLETLIRKTVPDFEIGKNIRHWWNTMTERSSFRSVYPALH